MMWRIGIIGLGEAGSAFCASLTSRGDVAVHGYDLRLDDPTFKRSLSSRIPDRAALVGSLEDLIGMSDYLFSLVTADAAVQVAAEASAFLNGGKTLLDANSVSPATSREIESTVSASGCRFVDLAVMASIPAHGHQVPMLASGPDAGSIADSLSDLGFVMKAIGDDPGLASAAKMMRSVIVKGVESLLIESLAAASAYGVSRHVLDSLDHGFPEENWHERAHYFAIRTARHALRRAIEMEQAAEAVSEAGVEPIMTRAAVERLRDAAASIRGHQGEVSGSAQLSALITGRTSHV
jgi:3-hydroxyisobutyrate dehydrogenase-like beta-hydroxyacid dehydrogenase